jgi:hypothetical protein
MAKSKLLIPSILFVTTIGYSSKNESICPDDMVLATPTVCIDKYEYPNQAGEKPLLGISGLPEIYDKNKGLVLNAEELCADEGKRVCNADEWVAACSGTQNNKYPFGNTLPKYRPGDNSGICNYDKLYIPVHEAKVFVRDPDEMAKLDQSEPSGSRKECVSPSGAYDMMGNAEEWVKCENGTEGWCLASRFWAQPEPCKALIVSHSPRWHYYNSSFRCCKDLK